MACEEAGPGWGGRELESFTVKHRPTHHGWMSATQGCWSEPNVQGKLAELGPVSEDTTSLNATTTAQNITRKTVPFSGFDGAFPSLMTHRLIIKGGCPAPPPHPVSNRTCMSLATTCARQHHPVMLVAWELRGPNRGKRGLPSKWCSNNPLVHLPSGSPCPRELVSPTPACCRRRLAVRYTASAVYAGSVESHGCLDAAAAGSLPTVVPSHGDSLGCWELIDARLRNRLPRPYPYLRAAPVLPADKIDKRNRATDSQLHWWRRGTPRTVPRRTPPTRVKLKVMRVPAVPNSPVASRPFALTRAAPCPHPPLSPPCALGRPGRIVAQHATTPSTPSPPRILSPAISKHSCLPGYWNKSREAAVPHRRCVCTRVRVSPIHFPTPTPTCSP